KQHLIERNVVISEQDERMIEKVGGLVNYLAPLSTFAGDHEFGGLLPQLFQDLVDSLGQQGGGVGIIGRVGLAFENNLVKLLQNEIMFFHNLTATPLSLRYSFASATVCCRK